MVSKLQHVLEIHNAGGRRRIVYLICQTLLYGIYLCLAPIAIHAMLTNGLRIRARKWLFAIITSMFVLTTMYWIASAVFTFRKFDVWNTIITTCSGSDNAYSCIVREVDANFMIMTAHWLAMFYDLLYVNYIIADGVLVWRAWVLCHDQNRIVLRIPVVMLGIDIVFYLITVVARAIQLSLISTREGRHHEMYYATRHIVSITQPVHFTLSVVINIFATSIITLKAWKYRKLMMENGIGIRTPKEIFKILAILVESGVFYILIGVTSLVFIYVSIRFEIEEITCTSMVIGIQLAGIYPIVVILLVEKNRSLQSTYMSFGTINDVRGDRPSHMEPIAFASGSVFVSSSGETEIVTKPPHTTIHVTFDHMLEPGDAGIDTGNTKVSTEGDTASY